MNTLWSRYEILVNLNKYSDVENQDLDNMQIPVYCLENPKDIIPLRVRFIYMDLYYQIQKYVYMENVIDFDEYVLRMRNEHIRKYAEINAGRILRGEEAIYSNFSSPNKPFLK